ncbi:MAG TPA: hypothetical protein VGM39_24150 [Kofleriaceae bacterium]
MRQGIARVSLIALAVLAACGDDSSKPSGDAGIDGGVQVTTETCSYEDMPATANATGTVTAGPLMAGAAERVLDIPVGVALGGYTDRAGFLGSAGTVDARKIPISGTFNPSLGVELAPRVKAVALSAGGETVVILKMDAIFVYEGMLFDLEQRLGPQFHGKVILAASHSHSAWAQFTGHGPLKLGSGQLRTIVFGRFLDTLEGTAHDALDAMQAAKLGIYQTSTFDPGDTISRDRRPENDALGGTKDVLMTLLRIDTTAGDPIAIVPIFGDHSVLNDSDNPFASSDAVGALERSVGEQFDHKVIVMQLQSAGGDVSGVGHGGLDCSMKPGKAGDPCFLWLKEEGHGRAAVPLIMDAWNQAATNMKTSLELEMMTRSIELGPKPETFTIRNGALGYAPFDGVSKPDGVIMDGDVLKNPVDEFNAPVGAALCETGEPMFPAAAIDGTEGVLPYGSCLKLDLAGDILGPIFKVDFGVDASHPVCETTRTNISALRIGDYTLGTMPGELTVPLKKLIISKAPDPTKTIVLGYAQGHVGYMLRPEDWVLGEYEASVTFWGPLEAEMIAEHLISLMPLVRTPERENGAEGGMNKVATARITDNLEVDNPAMMAGTVPTTIPVTVWTRTGPTTTAQPAAQISRVSGIAQYVFIGDDPQVKTPQVTLQVKSGADFVDVTRKSGRKVTDGEVLLAYTPSPLQRSGPQTHYWVVEWQAVPWVGSPTADDLDSRGGVPLGTYRFHVVGSTWTLDSTPFDVVAGGVLLTAPSRAGGQVKATINWYAPKGWRLLDTSLNSNTPVPVRSQLVTVDLIGAVTTTTTATTDASGQVSVTDVPAATMIRITDRFGNQGTIAIP